MDCYSRTSNFSFSTHSTEYSQNVQQFEETAKRALRNINLIYNEIMTPKGYDSEYPEFFDNNGGEITSDTYNEPNHYVRTCCNSVRELCIKCDRFISRCTSCNQCNCCKSNNNVRIVTNNEKFDKCHSTSVQAFKLKCTVPKPFSFCAKTKEWLRAKDYKISKIKQDIEKEVENELKIKANCKPVPKSTHLPLYNQMVQEQEQRKEKRKEKCIEILNNAKPFNLHTLKTSIKSKSSADLISENTHFRAKPTPKHILSDKISERLKNKEKVRKMLIGERAKQTIENSSSPFSQKTITYSRSCIDLYSLNKVQNKEDNKPKNISEITKRLYIKKCTETMENWNKKVLQVDTSKEILNSNKYNSFNEYGSIHKKQLSKKEELPFMYFPVRMSNAAILREKQVR